MSLTPDGRGAGWNIWSIERTMMILSTHGNHWAISLMPKGWFLTLPMLIPMLHVTSIWHIWISSASSISIICLPFIMVTLPLSITWKLIFRTDVVLQMYYLTYYFPSIFPTFSCLFLYTYAPLYGLNCFFCVVIILSHRHSLISLHMTNGNIPLV